MPMTCAPARASARRVAAPAAPRPMTATSNESMPHPIRHPVPCEGHAVPELRLVATRDANLYSRRMTTETDVLKRAAAAKALEYVADGMKLGLGTGSTAEIFLELLGPRVRGGLSLLG